MDNKTMIPFAEGLEIIKRFALPLGTEQVDLFHALNRTLAEDVFSDISMPPFNKSAMDGYACRKSDVNNQLQVIEEIPAGSIPTKSIGENQCARIMTGAMVPEGADWVIMKEHIEEDGLNQVRCNRETVNANICYMGEDVKLGDQVLKKGDVISPGKYLGIQNIQAVESKNPRDSGKQAGMVFSADSDHSGAHFRGFINFPDKFAIFQLSVKLNVRDNILS